MLNPLIPQLYVKTECPDTQCPIYSEVTAHTLVSKLNKKDWSATDNGELLSNGIDS